MLFNCLECIFGKNAGIKSGPSLSQNIHIICNKYSCFYNTVVYERGPGCLFFFHLHFSITFPVTYPILSHFTLPSLLGLLLNFALTAMGRDSLRGRSLQATDLLSGADRAL